MLVMEDLYLGDIRPSDRSFKRNSQYAKALDEVVKAGDALTDGLTEKQKELFEDFMTAQREVNVLTDCETFCQAFKLGAKIMLDVLTEGQIRRSPTSQHAEQSMRRCRQIRLYFEKYFLRK